MDYLFKWTEKDTNILIRLQREGLRHAQIADTISRLSGKSITSHMVKDRVKSLRRGGRLPAAGSSEQGEYETESVDVDLSELIGSGQTGDPAPTRPHKQDELIAKLVRETHRTRELEDLCDRLDMSPRRIRDLVELAQSRGVRVDIAGEHIGRKPAAADEVHAVQVPAAGDWRIMAIVGDVHIGSKHHLGAQLADFCKHAYARGVRQFFQVGDLLDGIYSHSVWEQCSRGFDEQCAEAARTLPQMPGATWHFIEGNHDETLGAANGLAVGPAIVSAFKAAGREDVVYHGARGAYIRVLGPGEDRGLMLHMWHPRDKGNAYARTYAHQKKVEGYPVGGKPDILACGHHHTQSYFTTRGVHSFGSGCWQGSGSSFAKSLRTAPDIGSWIVEYAMTEGGTVRNLRPEWVAYYEHEIAREVGLG